MAKERTRLTDDGCEILDDTPVALPVRFKRPESLVAQVQRLVAGEMSRLAEQAGYESFDEADDFDVGDEDDLRSQYELDDGQLEYDMRNDERYKKRAAAEERIAGEGDGEGEEDVRGSGKKVKPDKEGKSGDTGEAG